jgi:hypothetical protein
MKLAMRRKAKDAKVWVEGISTAYQNIDFEHQEDGERVSETSWGSCLTMKLGRRCERSATASKPAVPAKRLYCFSDTRARWSLLLVVEGSDGLSSGLYFKARLND